MSTISISKQKVSTTTSLKTANVLLLVFLGLSTCYNVWEPVENWVNIALLFIGTILVLSGLHLLFTTTSKEHLETNMILIVSTIVLITLNLILWPSKDYLPEQLIEHAAQMSLPMLLFWWMKGPQNKKNFILVLKLIIALTFVGHGLFAVAWHVLPAHFISMTQGILPLDTAQTNAFLFSAGLIDFVLAFLIFFDKTSRFALIYMLVWGLLTALARPLSHLQEVFTTDFWLIHFPGFVYRLPHAILPLLILVLSKKEKRSFVHEVN